MFWIFCAVIAAGTLLIKLGAMSVTVTVMSTALKVALALIVLLAGLLLWRWYRSKRATWKQL